jgi:hypothetical protein
MSDYDRRLDDIEKRLARLERDAERPAMSFNPPAFHEPIEHDLKGIPRNLGQFCPCGRDICRAPDCPSHRNDPLGR